MAKTCYFSPIHTSAKVSRGKKDRLLKHVKRIEELEKDLQGLASFTRLDTNLQIKGLIVFSNIVPMVFDETRLYKEKIDFISYDDLSCLVGHKIKPHTQTAELSVKLNAT